MVVFFTPSRKKGTGRENRVKGERGFGGDEL